MPLATALPMQPRLGTRQTNSHTAAHMHKTSTNLGHGVANGGVHELAAVQLRLAREQLQLNVCYRVELGVVCRGGWLKQKKKQKEEEETRKNTIIHHKKAIIYEIEK